MRFPVRIPASYFQENLNRTMQTDTDNISAEGLCLFCDKEIPVGTALYIHIEIQDNQEPLFRKGTVVWSQFNGPGKYRIGVKLEENIKPIPLVLRTITRKEAN